MKSLKSLHFEQLIEFYEEEETYYIIKESIEDKFL